VDDVAITAATQRTRAIRRARALPKPDLVSKLIILSRESRLAALSLYAAAFTSQNPGRKPPQVLLLQESRQKWSRVDRPGWRYFTELLIRKNPYHRSDLKRLAANRFFT
jgi:hypothetical protein